MHITCRRLIDERLLLTCDELLLEGHLVYLLMMYRWLIPSLLMCRR